MSTAKERIALNLNAVKEQSFKNVNVDLATIDRFRSDYIKIKSANTTIYRDKISLIRKDVLTGIKEVSEYQDKVKKVLSGLRSLGLNDEIKPFEFLSNDIDNDYKELLDLNTTLKNF